MASVVQQLDLRPDELAFHFASDRGVEVDALANLLKRAATVAGRSGAELRVVGILDGSLIVKLRTVPKSQAAQNAARKFIEDPLDQTLKATGLVGAIAGALIWAFGQGDSPLAKAGVEIVQQHQVTQITVITNNEITVVMDGATAADLSRNHVRDLRLDAEREASIGRASSGTQSKRQVAAMVEQAQLGNLTGEVATVAGQSHFRPDGFHFWVPIHSIGSSVQFVAGARYRVGGQIETLRGQPDRIVVQSADKIPS